MLPAWHRLLITRTWTYLDGPDGRASATTSAI
jgi:hypothetical protein